MPTETPSWSDTQEAPSWKDTEEPSTKSEEPDWKAIEAAYNKRLYEPPIERPSLGQTLKEGLQEGMQTVAESPLGLPAKALSFVPRPSAQQIQDVFDLAGNPLDPGAPSTSPSEAAKITAGTIGVGRGVAEGLASPIGIATLGAGGLPTAAQKVIGAAFVADMASGVPEQAARAGEASVTGDTQEQVEAFGNLAVTPIMAAAIGSHAMRPRIPEPVKQAIVKADDVGLTKSAQALADVAKTEQAKQEIQNAIPIEETGKEVLRDEGQRAGEGVGLPEVGARESGIQEPAAVRETQEVAPRLVPVVSTEGGRLYPAERHSFAVANALEDMRAGGISADDLSTMQQGFYDLNSKKFLTREQAAKAMKAGGEYTSEQIPVEQLKKNVAEFEASRKAPAEPEPIAELRQLSGESTTQKAMEIGAKVPKESIPELEKLVEESKAEASNIIAEVDALPNPTNEDLTRMSVAGNKAQLMSEALEAAKGGKPAILAREAKGGEPNAKKEITQEKVSNVLSETPPTKSESISSKLVGGEPEPIGMGGALKSEPPDVRAQIDQLAESLKGVNGKPIPVGEAVKRAFDLGSQIKTARGVVDSSLNALKTSGDFIKRAWQGVDKIDDVLRVKGELSAELNKNAWRIRQFIKDTNKALPDVKTREAIAKWVDAGGDDVVLRESLAKVPASKKAAYERALALTPEEKTAAQNIQNYFESRLKEAQDAGIVNEGIEDYIHRVYEKDTDFKKGALAQVQAGVLNTRTPGLALKRLFQMDADAEAAGYNVVSDFAPRIADYESSLAKVIASRAAVKRFSEIKMPDGRPMVDVGGVGIPVPESTAPEATLIKPSFKPGDDVAENNRKDYVARNYPALKKWKWVTTGENGQPVLVQGDVLIHPDAIKRVDSLLKPSAVRQSGVGRGALGVSSTFKNTMLDLSGFHQVQLAIHGAEHLVAPGFEMKSIDLTDPKVEGLLKGGITLGGEPHGMNYAEGLVGRSLSRQIPGLGPLMQTYHEWLFQDYIPRLKMTMATHALERNRARFKKDLASGKMSEEALNHLTAKEANAAFGELNYIMLERSRTAQDLSRLIMLAPDFLEARGRFAAQALTKRGGEQRMALLLGALTMFVTARIVNKIVDDQYHLEPENLFNVVYNGKSYGLRTVQQDILHAATEPFRFMLHRLNPTTTRPALEALTGRDEFGRKRDAWQILGDSIANVIPISLRSSREQHIWESMMNAFGITERRFNEVDSTYKLADKWKKEHKIQEPGEFIYDRDKDPLRGLKIALSENDEGEAAKEIAKLLKDGTYTRAKLIDHFRHYATAPFTGSFSNDRKFAATLSEDERKTYEASKEHKKNINKLFRQALARQ